MINSHINTGSWYEGCDIASESYNKSNNFPLSWLYKVIKYIFNILFGSRTNLTNVALMYRSTKIFGTFELRRQKTNVSG